MEKVKLSEKVTFSRIIQGFWRLTDWNFTTDELIVFMEECIARGVTTFDTAEIYGATECETQIGNALRKRPDLRSKIQIVTKTGIFMKETPDGKRGYYNTTYDRVIQSCKESLERLGCDYIDLYLIHREDPCFGPYDTAKALKELKQAGLIREAGVSNFDPYKYNALNMAMDGELVMNQIEWNPVCFEHFDSGMIDLLSGYKIRPMIWSPLAGGRLFNEDKEPYLTAYKKIKEVADRHNVDVDTMIYAYILYHPVGAMPISGSQKLERLDNAIKALKVELDHSEWYEIHCASGNRVLR